MSGALTFVGELPIAGLCPTVGAAFGPVLAQLQAKLTGLTALAAKLTVTPPAAAANLQLATQLVAALTAAAALAPPAVNFQTTAVAAQIAALELSVQVLLELQAALGAEVFVFTYAGPGAGFGPAVSAALGTGWPDGTSALTNANALVLATVTPAAWAALTAFFGGA